MKITALDIRCVSVGTGLEFNDKAVQEVLA
jgi:hypothetical protein